MRRRSCASTRNTYGTWNRIVGAWRQSLGGHPKPTIEGHFQNRPMVNITRDVDLDARGNTLGQHEQCLERRKEAASYSLGTAGMVPTQDPGGHRYPPDHCGRLSTGSRHPCATTGRLG